MLTASQPSMLTHWHVSSLTPPTGIDASGERTDVVAQRTIGAVDQECNSHQNEGVLGHRQATPAANYELAGINEDFGYWVHFIFLLCCSKHFSMRLKSNSLSLRHCREAGFSRSRGHSWPSVAVLNLPIGEARGPPPEPGSIDIFGGKASVGYLWRVSPAVFSAAIISTVAGGVHQSLELLGLRVRQRSHFGFDRRVKRASICWRA